MSEKPLPNWDELGFALVETDRIYRAFGDRGHQPVWEDGRLVPFAEIMISPAAAFLSYGQGVFEGLKARRSEDDRTLLFRPEANARRFARSAERLGMSPFPENEFVRGITELVRANARFLPPYGRGALYVRPVQIAIEPKLGLSLCDRFAVIMYGSPVGAYFEGGQRPGLRLRVLEQGRVAPGGTGSAKAMGNYAGTIPLAAPWKQRGFNDVLFLDARHQRYVTETVGSNVLALLESGVLVTPPLDDQILPGVTRDSVLRLARDRLGIEVEERELAIDEIFGGARELFCAGTAYTLQPVRELCYRDETREFPERETCEALFELLDGIQTGRLEDPHDWIRAI